MGVNVSHKITNLITNSTIDSKAAPALGKLFRLSKPCLMHVGRAVHAGQYPVDCKTRVRFHSDRTMVQAPKTLGLTAFERSTTCDHSSFSVDRRLTCVQFD